MIRSRYNVDNIIFNPQITKTCDCAPNGYSCVLYDHVIVTQTHVTNHASNSYINTCAA